MKKIEDIERMTEEELEAAALKEDIRLPEGLKDRIKASLAAESIAEESARKRSPLPYIAVAAAAAVAAIVAIPHRGPAIKDTYSDPYLAYAKVEETFNTISNKMAAGISLAGEAADAAGKPAEIINKINSK